MSTVVAIQPAMPRPTAIPVSAARPRPKKVSSGKENIPQSKSSPTSTPANNARSRRERPCDACRRRKSRCVIRDGALICVLCDFHKQECTFLQDPQPRKRKVVTDPATEDNNKKRSSDVSPAIVAQKPPTITRTPPIAPSPVQYPVGARDPSALGDTLGLQRRQHSKYLGLTTPFDPLLIGLTQFDTRNESISDLGILRKVNDHECFIMLSDETMQPSSHDAEILMQVEQIVAPHGQSLIVLYFRTVHPSFPIIQKQLLLERYRTGDRTFSPALMAGIYILALNWWAHDPALAVQTKPDVAQLEAIASSSLSASMERPKLSTVQAGLLLLQRPEADSWNLTTQLVAIGQELGLHLDCSNWSIPIWERGLRKRIAWALYMQDKWSSLIHGRPSHIFSANWAVKPISDHDFVEDDPSVGSTTHETTPEEKEDMDKGRSIFSQMISLTSIMAEVMDTFYTQVAIADFAAAGKNSTRLILERAKPVQIRLKDWFSKLPPQTRMETSSTTTSPAGSPTRLSSTGYLHLAYFATEITLHRRIVQSLSTSTSDPYLLYICRQAAKTRLISAMDFVNRLKPTHLQSFWYFASKINFTLIGTFGSLLWATAPAKEEAEFYKYRLKEYRWTLSVSAKRAEFLEHAVTMLDASRAMLSKLAEKPTMAQQSQISNAGIPPAASSSTSGSVIAGPSGQMQEPPPTSTPSLSRASTVSTAMNMMGDVEMGEAPLRRYESTSSFAGFGNEEMYTAPQQGQEGEEGESEGMEEE